jgi:hypothetical protein
VNARPKREFRRVLLSLLLALGSVGAVSVGLMAQEGRAWPPEQAPRFLRVPADSTEAPTVVDPSDIPIFRRRIAMHLDNVTRREALNELSRASGLQFVYANDVIVAADAVRLQADDITVVAALTEVLLGAGVDVAIGADGNAILVRRSAPVAQVSRQDVVRGRVTTDSGVAIAGADAIVTVAPSAESFRTLTDSSGRYSIAITDGSGEYLLYVGAPGRRPFRQRLTRVGGDTTFVVDVKLASNVTTTMATVRVQARRPRPTRSLGGDAPGSQGTTGNDRTVDGVTGALPPDLATNLDAMATLIPGLAVGAGGISAFGMTSDANLTTLNGLAFGGGDLPRDLRTTTRFSTSLWDPTRGGFAGVLEQQNIGRGGNISSGTAHLTFDDPSLQFSDPIAAHIGREVSNIQVSQGGSGAYALDKLFYNYGLQLSRKTASVASLTDLDAAALSLAGVSADSAARFLQTLPALHIPVNVAGVAPRLATNSASFVERIDHAPPTIPFGSNPPPAWSLTGYASYKSMDPQSLTPFAPNTFAGTAATTSAWLQGYYASSLDKEGYYQNETSSAIQYNETRGTPYVSLPAGNVLISSTLPDGSTGLGALDFGGNGFMASDFKKWSWELVNQTDFLAARSASLPMKLYLQSRFDGYSMSPAANRFGSFGFPTLAALAANVPSTYSRTLNVPSTSGNEWTGAAALGGSYTKGPLTLTGGARVDANVFLTAPAENPAVATLFGEHTDHAPSSLAVSPRLGFTYNVRGGTSQRAGQLYNLFGGPSQIRGGIGEFRGTAPPALLSNAMMSTGLPGGARRLLCTGSAAPTPDWQAYATDTASIPSGCEGTSTLADTTPAVRLVDRSWSVPESWHATLGWTMTMFSTYLATDATYAVNLHQPGTRDLNFAGVPRFSLADEGNRPVFVSPSSIDPGSGAMSAVESRSSSAYGSVNDQVSDLRSESRQLTVYAIPNFAFKFGVVTLGYTYADVRSQSRGFDLSTAGDPRLVDWAPGPFTPRHTFNLQVAKTFGNQFGITVAGRAISGLPFTPLVAGDINGDGLANDRAFVFDPSTASDPPLASAMRTLMTSGPSAARDCLNKQLARLAAQSSCTGPWSGTMQVSAYAFPALPWTDDRARVSLSFFNVLGGLDELLHGSAHLQGWGMTPLPDQTLLRVRGFDGASNSFLYTVNPRFGSTSLATTSVRTPFRITLDVSVDVGHSGREQQLDQNLRLRPALLGTRAPADSIKRRYMSCGSTDCFQDFYGYLLVRWSDSLALSSNQIRQMQDEREVLRVHADSIYTVLASYLVALPADYDRKEALKRITAATDAAWAFVYAEKTFLLKLLTPGQVRRLPRIIFDLVTVPNYKGRFVFAF